MQSSTPVPHCLRDVCRTACSSFLCLCTLNVWSSQCLAQEHNYKTVVLLKHFKTSLIFHVLEFKPLLLLFLLNCAQCSSYCVRVHKEGTQPFLDQMQWPCFQPTHKSQCVSMCESVAASLCVSGSHVAPSDSAPLCQEIRTRGKPLAAPATGSTYQSSSVEVVELLCF